MEKENAALPVKQVKGKTGRAKLVKVKEETLPTPQGRRIIPRVTSAMKADATKKADVNKGDGKRGRKPKVLTVCKHFFLASIQPGHYSECTVCYISVVIYMYLAGAFAQSPTDNTCV